MPEIIAPVPFNLTGEERKAYEDQEWRKFAAYLTGFPELHRQEIENGYNFAQYIHRDNVRISGHRAFEHSRATAITLIDELHHKDPDTINTALLHDVEDTYWWSSPEINQGHILHISFSEKVCTGVISLNINPFPFGKEAGEREIKREFPGFDGFIQLVKLSERLHNIRTLSVMPQDKQYRKILDTYLMMPRCGNAREEYPEETRTVTELLKDAMRSAEGNLSKFQRLKLKAARSRIRNLAKAGSDLYEIITIPRQRLGRVAELP